MNLESRNIFLLNILQYFKDFENKDIACSVVMFWSLCAANFLFFRNLDLAIEKHLFLLLPIITKTIYQKVMAPC